MNFWEMDKKQRNYIIDESGEVIARTTLEEHSPLVSSAPSLLSMCVASMHFFKAMELDRNSISQNELRLIVDTLARTIARAKGLDKDSEDALSDEMYWGKN